MEGTGRPVRTQTFLVVLTATITPSQGAKVIRNDPKVRREDYANGLRFWLSHPDQRLNRILFLENSREDLSYFQHIVAAENAYGKEVEFVSTDPAVIPKGISFGWGELRMLDEGLERSQLARESSQIIKATGRLRFPDIVRLLDRTPPDCEAMIECRIATAAFRKGLTLIPALITRKEAYASTQLLIVSRAFYEERIRGLYKTMTPEPWNETFESTLYKQLRAAEKDRRICFRFPVNCEPAGISGTHNSQYDSPRRRLVRVVRAVLRGTGIWI